MCHNGRRPDASAALRCSGPSPARARFMTAALVRGCPQCGSERPAAEPVCENQWNGGLCGWSLLDVPLHPPRGAPLSPIVNRPTAALRKCANGHVLDPRDALCMQCGTLGAPGSGSEETQRPAGADERLIGRWRILETLEPVPDVAERFLVEDSRDAPPGRDPAGATGGTPP